MQEADDFSLNPVLEKAYFIAKLTGRAMVRPASSDIWKAPLNKGVSGSKFGS